MKLFYIFLMSLLTITNSYSQKHFNNWYFGNKAGLTFNNPSGEPVVLIDGSMDTAEGCSTISDSSGNLLFYTDGRNVWNKNHQLMTNGTGLAGHTSSSQCGLIVPKPNSDDIYYIFTNDAIENVFSKGFNYSIVDITLENGLGAVTQKNINIFNNKSEKVSAVTHKNGIDIWIVTQDIDKEVFTVFLLNDKGLDTKRIESPGTFSQNISKAGMIKFSPQGNKLALSEYKIPAFKLYDFDNETGKITNEMNFSISSIGSFETYGIEFSENGKMIYVSSNNTLHQFDISSNNKLQIQNSEHIIYETTTGQQLWALERAPNDKIYIANRGLYLSVINKPNLQGNKCEFEYYAVDLKGSKSVYGLPNAIKTYNFVKKRIDSISVCTGDSILLTSPYFANCTYQWGGPSGFTSIEQNPKIVTSDTSMSGDYSYFIRENDKIISQGTINVTVHRREKILFSELKEIVVCEDFYDLQAVENPTDCIITWSGLSSNENILHIVESGSYSVYVENLYGCRDSAKIDIRLKISPDLEILGDRAFCTGEKINLSANYDYDKFLWSTGETTKSIIIDNEGYYYLITEDINGCPDSTGINVTEFGKNIRISKNNNDFGILEAGNKSEFSFTIFNNEANDITIRNIFIKHKPIHFELVHTSLPIVLKSKESINILINFIPKFDDIITDSLEIQIDAPCFFKEYISLNAISKGQILVDFWLPDTTAEVGTDNFRIPIYLKLRNASNYEFRTNIKAKITYLKSLYYVDNLSSGFYTTENMKDSISFNIELNDVAVTNSTNIISYFEGLVLFNEIGTTNFKIENLEFDNPYLIINSKDGSLSINHLCNPELKGIKYRNGSFIGINNESNNIILAKAYCGQAGNYGFSVISSSGILLYSTSWTTASASERHFELNDIISSSGLYLLVLKSPDEIISQKITLIK